MSLLGIPTNNLHIRDDHSPIGIAKTCKVIKVHRVEQLSELAATERRLGEAAHNRIAILHVVVSVQVDQNLTTHNTQHIACGSTRI